MVYRRLKALLLAVDLRDDFGELPRHLMDVVMADLALLAETLLAKSLLPLLTLLPGVLLLEGVLLPRAVSRLPLPAHSLLAKALLAHALLTKPLLAEALLAALLHGLQQLREHRQDLPHNLADVLRRQGPLAAEATAKGRHRLVLVLLLLLLGLGNDLRQRWRDLLQQVTDLVRGEALLPVPVLAAALTKVALTIAALTEGGLAERILAYLAKTLLGLLVLHGLQQLLYEVLEVSLL